MTELPHGSETGDKGRGQNQFKICLRIVAEFYLYRKGILDYRGNLPVKKTKMLHKNYFLKNLLKNTSELTK